jgi:hypothetical protein
MKLILKKYNGRCGMNSFGAGRSKEHTVVNTVI